MARRSKPATSPKSAAAPDGRNAAHPWYVNYRDGKEIDPKNRKGARARAAKAAPRRSSAESLATMQMQRLKRSRRTIRPQQFGPYNRDASYPRVPLGTPAFIGRRPEPLFATP